MESLKYALQKTYYFNLPMERKKQSMRNIQNSKNVTTAFLNIPHPPKWFVSCIPYAQIHIICVDCGLSAHVEIIMADVSLEIMHVVA